MMPVVDAMLTINRITKDEGKAVKFQCFCMQKQHIEDKNNSLLKQQNIKQMNSNYRCSPDVSAVVYVVVMDVVLQQLDETKIEIALSGKGKMSENKDLFFFDDFHRAEKH